MAAQFDVVVATVGQRDVSALPRRPGAEPPDRRNHTYRHPIHGVRLEDLRRFGQQAVRWLVDAGSDEERRARARDVRFPLLDPVLEHLARASADPPAVLLVATDQEDERFRPGDTIEVARFMQEALGCRDDGRVKRDDAGAKVEMYPAEAAPSDFGEVLKALTVEDRFIRRVCAARAELPVRVGLASTGGTAALTAVVTLVLATAASGRLPRVGEGRVVVRELRVRPGEQVHDRGLLDVLGHLGLAPSSAEQRAG